MSKPTHTPHLRLIEPQPGTMQRSKVYGPRHADGGEYAPICEIADHAMARQIVASYNAFESAADRLGVNAVELAERMAEGGLAELVTAFQDCLPNVHGHSTGDFSGRPWLQKARAALARVWGDSA